MPDMPGLKLVKTIFSRRSSKDLVVDLPSLVEVKTDEQPILIQNFNPNAYTVVSRLGRGSFGYVDLVRSGETFYALKYQKARRRNFGEEIDTLVYISQKGDHDNIAKLHWASGDDTKTGLIAMEYIDGISLNRLTTPMNESQLRLVTRQVVSGLRFLHSIGVVHRDIKPENIMLDRNGNVKIIDLGIAHNFSTTAPDTATGSLLYMSPEQICCLDRPISYGPRVDCWALGISLIELALGKLPNNDLSKSEVVSTIKKGDSPTLAKMKRQFRVDTDFSADFHDFVSACVKRNPQERPSAMELSHHRWLMEEEEEQVKESLVNLVKDNLQRRRLSSSGRRNSQK
ncbi:hypothetical protein PROFUN_00548 [Planoprotostelium fungivorum]|uniref:Protein kinase domain-containing protein n=1 Tax=Planoprotostelium fungivorum TaxID=1890364 RepID=A0A2P6N141_9EUKA|nr:hypothetical protein PROFUN_00548 [Planoprotostelium fungivorum]